MIIEFFVILIGVWENSFGDLPYLSLINSTNPHYYHTRADTLHLNVLFTK